MTRRLFEHRAHSGGKRRALETKTSPSPQHEAQKHDPVNHPEHYTSQPSGVECIQVVEWMGFNLGNAVKYVWRADLKGNATEDLKKARWYIDREILRRASLRDERRAGSGPGMKPCGPEDAPCALVNRGACAVAHHCPSG